MGFLRRVCDVNNTAVDMELLNLPKRNVNFSLLLSSGEYSTIESRNLHLLDLDDYTLLSAHFKNIYNVTSEILLTPIDNCGFEIDYMLEEEELESSNNKESIIKECARAFFEILKPLYGCCGTEMFVEKLKDIEEERIMNSKFYCIGYVDFALKDKFNFINYSKNFDEFLKQSLDNGTMYVRKSYFKNPQ